MANTIIRHVGDWNNYHMNGPFPTKILLDVEPDRTIRSLLNRYNDCTTEIQSLLKNCIDSGERLRAVGSGWSLSGVAHQSDRMLFCGKLNISISIADEQLDPATAYKSENLFLFQCGNTIKDIAEYLFKKGKSLKTCGTGSGQTIVGAISTGVHGSAIDVGSMQDSVVGIHLITGPAANDVLYLERATRPALNDNFGQSIESRVIRDDSLFNAALVSLGSFGVIGGLVIEAEDIFLLKRYVRKISKAHALQIATTMDFDRATFQISEEIQNDGKAIRPYHFNLLINPYNKDEHYLAEVIYKKPYRTNYPDPVPLLKDPVLTDGIGWISAFGAKHKRLIPKVLAGLRNETFREVKERIIEGTLSEIFGTTTESVPVFAGGFGLNISDASRVLKLIMQLIKKKGPVPAILSMRFVKGSEATLAFTKFPITCVLDLDGLPWEGNLNIISPDEFLKDIVENLRKNNIDFTLHWGKNAPWTFPNLADIMYGTACKTWKDARSELLSDQMADLFSNDFLQTLGLNDSIKKKQREKVNVYISYSQNDREYLDEFLKHLNILKRSDIINEIYSDQLLKRGEDWEKKLITFMEDANIIIFLQSPDSISSANINLKEWPRAIEKYKKGKAHILVIPVRSGITKNKELERFIYKPGGRHVTEWTNRDEAWQEIVLELKRLVNKLTANAALHLIEQAKANHSPVLDLGNCGLKDIPNEVFDLEWLEGLILGSNKDFLDAEQYKFFNEPCGDGIADLWQYHWFTKNDGEANDLLFYDLNCLEKLTRLRFLNINGCRANIAYFDFSVFPNLTILFADNNHESGTAPVYIGSAEPFVFAKQCAALKVLSLSRNNIVALPERFFGAIASTIQYLNISLNPQLNVSFFAYLDRCAKLLSLDLESINLQDLFSAEKIEAYKIEPTSYDNLYQLEWLRLNRCELKNVLFLRKLPGLKFVYANYNFISDLTPLTGLSNLKLLHLANNNLSSIDSVRNVKLLESLDLSNNTIDNIESLGELTQLKQLNISTNRVKSISALKTLQKLTHLVASNNQIDIVHELLSCKQLQLLDITRNVIDDLKEIQLLIDLPALNELLIQDNPLKTLDQHTLMGLHSLDLLKEYFSDFGEKELIDNNEVKLILVGNSTAGKSTLRRMIQGKSFDDNEGTTHGIVRDVWEIPMEGNTNPVKVYIWDFGGQEYYHETHRLFFSKNAVYVLVWELETNKNEITETYVNVRDDKSKIKAVKKYIEHYSCEYWLKNIAHFAPESPVIMVQNKIDKYFGHQDASASQAMGQAMRVQRVPENLLDTYNITDSFEISLEKVKNNDEDYIYDYKKLLHILRKRLLKTTAEFKLEANFYKIKEEILKKKKSGLKYSENNWSFNKFKKFCLRFDPDVNLERLIEYLCNISIIMYFKEKAELKDSVIVNPIWVSDQIYKVLNQRVLENSGHFNNVHVERVIGAGMAKDFIALMMQFEIIFKDDIRKEFIAPQYLPETNINRYYTLVKSQLLQPRFVLSFPKFLPKTIMNSILAMYAGRAIESSYHKYGVAFSTDYDGLNILEYDFKMGSINFYSKNNDQFNTREVFESILSLFENVRISDSTLTSMDPITESNLALEKVKVLLSVDGETFINWNKLFLQRSRLQDNTVLIPDKGKEIHAGAFRTFYLQKDNLKSNSSDQAKKEPVKLFISYAHKDESYKDELIEHLSGLKRQGIIDHWTDRAILPGEKWDDVIKKNLNESQIILFLVSPSFLASDYIQDYEIKSTIERSMQDSKVTIMPIHIRPCDFTSLPLKDYQGGIENFKALSSWPNKDEAWMDVINKLKTLIQEKFGSNSQ